MADAATTDLTATINGVVDRYIELLTSGTAEQIADLYAEGASVEDPIGAPLRTTRDELVEFYGLICNLDEHVATLKWKKVVGDTAVFEFHLFTKAGDSGFEIQPIDIMTFDENGKIASMRAVWDPATDLKQV
ncbi:putative delta(5)-3-ketosteroid isomerase [Gordonia araii NBRC 100433]|uniref:Putative delta(5)-3-ketosteroid isomerase n=1 Tax=Gordonia araii NBRC 100433 TaxID=1073574 RepID=G7H6D0_9ACTN|nr:nuclear transport factor 2 family protein [Gordonia araii]NNG96085.1 SnoaL-like domain-containing protein [Gordonia araii NBRC 100433]GAB11405.1 putative delta(5)-3-ketosteroid isomerase [Gordonia araii NBRC 100433]